MAQGRLNSLAILAIENDEAKKTTTDFNEILSTFVHAKARRMPFNAYFTIIILKNEVTLMIN